MTASSSLQNASQLPVTTIPDLLANQIRQRPREQALALFHRDRFVWLTWEQIADDVGTAALAMEEAGVRRGDCVGQIGGNDYAWIVFDFAVLKLGAIHVPLHPDLPEAEQLRQLGHAGATWVANRRPGAKPGDLAGDPRLQRLTSVEGCLPSTSDWAPWGPEERPARRAGESGTPETGPPESRAGGSLPRGSSSVETRGVPTGVLAGGVAAGGVADMGRMEAGRSTVDDVATILFTSGTSGACRAVPLTHANLTSNVAAVVASIDSLDPLSARSEIRLLILPLTHIYARTCDLYVWLYRGSRMALVESRDTILRDCQLTRPTTLNAVPYFYQKIADKIGVLPENERADALRRILGGAIERCYCGGAAAAPAVERLFADAGLPLLSGYGLSEASPVVTAADPTTYEPGTVGRPLANLTVRVADDGEVLVRGPSVMAGYWRDPAATKATLADGWLHTGDVGAFTSRGNLRIVGRKKELMALSTGKHVWPGEIEALLAGSALIEQACLIGEGRAYLTALIVPQPDGLRGALRSASIWIWSRRRVLSDPRVQSLYRREIDRILAGAAAHEQIGRFRLVGRMFDAAHGETTAKLSLRRDAIARNFAQEIWELYAERAGESSPR